MVPSPESFSAFLARHPLAQYWLLVLLGAFGIYLSMPIAFDPESTLEWIDLEIGLQAAPSEIGSDPHSFGTHAEFQFIRYT